jgi:hypothetical protein
MRIRLEVRDRSFNMVEILDKEYLDLSWSYSRIGGCGEFSFTLPRKLFEERAISGDYNVRIYHWNEITKVFDLWYQGLIENKVPNVRGNSEDIQISGHGYQSQLSRIYVQTTYTGQEASVIVKNLLDNYIVPSTNISYSVPDIQATSFTFDTLDFNTDALSAMQTIADTVGTREWGVDRNRNFFFKSRSSTVGFRYTFGRNITNYSENQDFKQVINRIIVQGAQVGGTYFTATYNDTNSQLKYGLRTAVKQNSSINSNTVASQLATATFAEFNDVIRKANFDLVGIEAQIESTTPIPLVNFLIKQDKYGEKKFGEGLYSGMVDHVINRINYTVTNNNSLKIGIDLGKIRPAISEEIAQVEYQLEQLRSAAL